MSLWAYDVLFSVIEKSSIPGVLQIEVTDVKLTSINC